MDGVLRDFLNRLRLLLWAGAALGQAIVCTVLFVLTVVAFPLVIVWVGIPLLFATIVTVRPMSHWHTRLGSGVGRTGRT